MGSKGLFRAIRKQDNLGTENLSTLHNSAISKSFLETIRKQISDDLNDCLEQVNVTAAKALDIATKGY